MYRRIVGEMQKTILMDSQTTIQKVLSGLVQSEHISVFVRDIEKSLYNVYITGRKKVAAETAKTPQPYTKQTNSDPISFIFELCNLIH